MNDPEREDLPSASKLSRIIACPGSPALENSIPEKERVIDVPDEITLSGQRIHKALADPSGLLDLSEQENETFKIAARFKQDALLRWIEDFTIQEYEAVLEQRFWLWDADLNRIASGQPDVVYVSKKQGRAIIPDYKTGYVPDLDPAQRNAQLRLYAVLVWREYDIPNIRVVLIKPKVKYEPTDACDYSLSDLQFAEKQIQSQLWFSKQPDAPRHPGKQCHYCAAKGVCPEAGAYTMLPTVIANRAAAVNLTDKDQARYAVWAMKPADLLRVWEVSKTAKWIIDAVDARLKSLPKEQLTELGLEISKGRQIDPITNVRGAYEYLTSLGWTEDDIWTCLSLSKEKVATLARKEKSLSSDNAAKAWVGKALSDFITPQQANGSLKRIKE